MDIFTPLTILVNIIQAIFFDGFAAFFFNIFKSFFLGYAEIVPYIQALGEIFALLGGATA